MKPAHATHVPAIGGRDYKWCEDHRLIGNEEKAAARRPFASQLFFVERDYTLNKPDGIFSADFADFRR
jgi:hypothetical protein